MNLTYCPRCKKLFARGMRDVCNACVLEIEKEYETVVAYLKEHKGAHIQQVADETGVSIKQITKFIREGRISQAQASNITIPCEVCGLPIHSGAMCDSCRGKLQRDMRNLQGGGQQQGSQPQGAQDSRQGTSFQIRDRQ